MAQEQKYFNVLFENKKRINSFKRCVLSVPFLRALIKTSLLSVTPFSERKKEIVSSSSVITMDV